MTAFALCRTCPEITTGVLDSAKGFLLAQSSNHHNCDVVPFGDPTTLPMPIRAVVLRLGAGLPITNDQITMLRLGIDMEDSWRTSRSTAPSAENVSTNSHAPVRESAASTRSQPASTPTSATSAASDDVQMTLFGDVT